MMYLRGAKSGMFNWHLAALLAVLCAVGLMLLYSAGRTPCSARGCVAAFGGWSPWAISQLPKVLFG
ncbi:MAG: hypothetical protein LBT92_01280, partial [Rickettsiales bacterium]|nr:hypothetical protein [Rickettsiales bacterium]